MEKRAFGSNKTGETRSPRGEKRRDGIWITRGKSQTKYGKGGNRLKEVDIFRGGTS